MKKVENLLLLPIVVLFVLSLLAGNSTLDIHLHDTYYVINNYNLAKWFTWWLVVMFILYKLIRRKQGRVDERWAVPHIAVTVVLIALMWFPAVMDNGPMPRRYLDYGNDMLQQMITWYRIIFIGGLVFALVQLAFLVYFIIQLIRSPRPN